MNAQGMKARKRQAGGIGFTGPALQLSLTPIHLFFALVLALSACSQPQPDLQRTPTPSPSRAAAQETPTPRVGLEAENAVITFAGYSYDRPLYAPIIAAFNEQYAPLKVQFVQLPEFSSDPEAQANYFRSLASAADTTTILSSAAGAGQYFRDLQPLLESDPSFDVEGFWPSLLDGCLDPEGRMVGVPLDAGFYGVFYDEAAFDQAGLPHPAPGWTFDDLREAAGALARKEGDTIRYGLAEQGQLFTSLLAPVVDAHLLDRGGEPEAEALLDEIGWYLELVEKEAIYTFTDPENLEKQWQDWESLFKSKSPPAMWVADLGAYLPGAQWTPSESDPFAGTALENYGFAPYPVSADGSLVDTSPIWTQCAAMSAGAANPRAAWTWLSFLSRQSLLRDRSQAYELTRLPARRSVAEAAGFWESLPDQAEPAVLFALEHPWLGPAYPEAFEAVGGALNQTLSGQMDFAGALASGLAEFSSTAQPTSGAVVVATPRPTLPAETTVIDFFFNLSGGGSSQIFAEIEAYQKEHPGVAIEMDTDFGGFFPEDTLPYLAGEYDCFVWYPFFEGEGYTTELLNLNTLFQAEGGDFTGDFYPPLLDSFRLEGDLYGLPAFSQPQVMAFNPELLEKRGLALPSLEWTFDDFLSLVAGAASTQEGDESYGFLTSEWEDWLLRGRGALGYDLTQKPTAVYFDSPEMLSALQWLAELQESNTILIQTEDNWASTRQTISAGKIAFWSSQGGVDEQMVTNLGGPLTFEIGLLPMPALPESAGYNSFAALHGYFISQRAVDPQVCWDWIRHLSDRVDTFKGVPARRSLAESPNWEAVVGADRAEVYRAALSRVNFQPDPVTDATGWPYATWLSQAVGAALRGEDPQIALADIQVKAENYAACMAGVDASGVEPVRLFEGAKTCAKQADPDGDWPE